MKTLEQRAEAVVGWHDAIMGPLELYDVSVKPYWFGREAGPKRDLVGILALGDLTIKLGKILTVAPFVMYNEHAFCNLARQQGYDVDQLGPLPIAQNIVAQTNGQILR